MNENICLIGFDEPEIEILKQQISGRVIAHPSLPGFRVEDGQLYVDNESGGWQSRVDRVIFHGIFESDAELFVALALWGGPCFPDPLGMLNCRDKHACLVRALSQTQFPGFGRGYVPAGGSVKLETEQVAKWGNWHCGENKARVQGEWSAEFSSTLEPFYPGNAVRVVLLGDEVFQIQLTGDDWLKSIHDPTADFMNVDADLAEDTRALAQYFNLPVIANDYVVGEDGEKYLLEVNHIPNVTRFPLLWERYTELVINWCRD
ncbi:ATP-grasp domain-containing protein [Gimesia algae]|uniref:ATP-grasp domain-containing protein n=1 Tax=Gimesia algae TaxID=2527971 RepID=A0A517VAP5_9PLAN|nr:hypothetical protein [Gimesia algae]QDT90059.1 hypothetical protein Pan161_16930 [Gimesia algae]